MRDPGSCSRADRPAADRAAGDRAAGDLGGAELPGRLARRGLPKNDCIPLAPARAPAARPQIEPPVTAPPDTAAARSYRVARHVEAFVKMTAYPWLLLARRPPGRRSSRR